MNSASIDAAELRFPPRCARCGGPPETVHEIEARRGIDLLFVAYHRTILLAIPVCRRCGRHRRLVGVAAFVGTLLAIFGGGLVCMQLAITDRSTAGVVTGGVIGLLAILARLGLDDLVEWTTVGVHPVWRRGPGTPLMLHFRRSEYFAAWAAVNPRRRWEPDGHRGLGSRCGYSCLAAQ